MVKLLRCRAPQVMESAIFLAPYSLACLSYICPAESHLPLPLTPPLPLPPPPSPPPFPPQVCTPITHLTLHLAYAEVCIHTQGFILHKSK